MGGLAINVKLWSGKEVRGFIQVNCHVTMSPDEGRSASSTEGLSRVRKGEASAGRHDGRDH